MMDPAAQAYDGIAESYDSVRPTYAAVAIADLCVALSIGPGKVVVDLGAGTGKLTAALIPSGAALIALEPLPKMRALIERSFPQVKVIAGTAEELPLESSSVDVCVAGQSWHWFDGPRALRECGRVLRQQGGLGLLWNEYDRSIAWVRQFADVYQRRIPPGRAQIGDLGWRTAFAQSKGWSPLVRQRFPNPQRTTRTGVIGRALSSSWIAALPEASQRQVIDEIEAILDANSQTRRHDAITLPYITELYWCHHIR